MKKTIAVISALVVVVSAAFAGCGNNTNPQKDVVQETTTTFDELASYYDELAKGEIAVEIETTADRNSIFEFSGDENLLPNGIYGKIRSIVTQRYDAMYAKYGKDFSAPKITLIIDAGYNADSACYSNGKTIYINPNWFADHPDDSEVILTGLFQTMQEYQGKYPEWIESSIATCARREFATYYADKKWNIPANYSGKSYEEGGVYGASFLFWVNAEFDKNFVYRLHKALLSGIYDETFWEAETGLTFGQLWSLYMKA